MDVKSVMTPNPVTCSEQTPLREVARLMAQNDCGQIPVVDERGVPVGVITDRDIAIRAVADGRDPASCTAGMCMSSPVTTLSVDSDLGEACDLMESAQIRRLLLVDGDGRLVGILAQADIALSGRDRKTAEMVRQVSEPLH